MSVVVTAVTTAIEVTTVASVLSAVAAVGTAMTVVGVVTGSKELTKIGGTLGIVGGIGGLANAAFSGLAGAAVDAGVAEGASAGAYSDVAGEQFALSQGMDAAGSGFGAGAANAAGSAGIINDAQGVTSAAPASSVASGINSSAPLASGVQPPPIDGSLAGIGNPDLQLPTPDANAAAGGASSSAPQSLSDSTLSDAYSDVAGEKYALGQGMDAAGSGFGLSPLENFKKTIGDGWSKLSPQTQAEVAKSLLAIPGGIQNQKNFNAQLDVAKQRANQTSHGSEVPTFGIINKAMKGG